MRKQLETEIKVGIFVSVGVILLMIAVIVLGNTENLLSSKNKYHAHFSNVDGLISGAKVILGGVSVGTVEGIGFDREKRNIRVDFSVVKSASTWIRNDSSVEIATQGVLGDKYISIDIGSEDQPELKPGSDLPNRPSKDISEFISKGDQLMVSLNHIANSVNRILKTFETDHRSDQFFQGMAATSKNLALISDRLSKEVDNIQIKKTIANLNHIFEKINNGTGTIGALVNDSSLYDEFRALMGGANRNRIIRNLVRQTIKSSEEAASNSTSPSPRPEPQK
jgi:phospholipid/cholesterol/gamma-HCH transport system substrate-binding protein